MMRSQTFKIRYLLGTFIGEIFFFFLSLIGLKVSNKHLMLKWTHHYIFLYHSSVVQVLGPIINQHMIRHVHWDPSLEGIIKVNVDVSSFGNPDNAGFDGLLKNDMRIWIQGFFGSYGRASN